MRTWIRLALLSILAFGILKGANAQGETASEQPASSQGADLTGFDGFRWGDTYDEVRAGINELIKTGAGNFPIEKLSDTPYKEIRIKRGNVIYKYVFYQRPGELKRIDPNAPEGATEEAPLPEATDDFPDNPASGQTKGYTARLFFVEATFSYVPSDKIYAKLNNKYGRRTTTVESKDFRGAYIWELTNGMVIQWVDPYNEKPYTRSIYYYSRAITAEIMEDLKEYNFVEELKTVIDLLP